METNYNTRKTFRKLLELSKYISEKIFPKSFTKEISITTEKNKALELGMQEIEDFSFRDDYKGDYTMENLFDLYDEYESKYRDDWVDNEAKGIEYLEFKEFCKEEYNIDIVKNVEYFSTCFVPNFMMNKLKVLSDELYLIKTCLDYLTHTDAYKRIVIDDGKFAESMKKVEAVAVKYGFELL